MHPLPQRYRGRPTGALAKLRVVSQEHGLIPRAQSGRMHDDFHLDPTHAEHGVEDVLDLHRSAGAQVVNLSRLPLVCEQSQGPHDVPHVGEVSARRQAPDVDSRFMEPLRGQGNLLTEGLYGAAIVLPGAHVIEGPGHVRPQPQVRVVLNGEQLLGNLDDP